MHVLNSLFAKDTKPPGARSTTWGSALISKGSMFITKVPLSLQLFFCKILHFNSFRETADCWLASVISKPGSWTEASLLCLCIEGLEIQDTRLRIWQGNGVASIGSLTGRRKNSQLAARKYARLRSNKR